MNFWISVHLKRALLFVGVLAFACRLVIPSGFMPAGLSEGGLIILCPHGLPDGFSSETQTHHDHPHGQETTSLEWDRCALGTLFDVETLVVDVDSHTLNIRRAPTGLWRQKLFVSTRLTAFRSRAPPVLDSLI